MSAAERGGVLPLLEDGSLAVRYESDVAELVERWLPRLPAPTGAATAEAAIDVGSGSASIHHPPAEPTLRLGTASAWYDPGSERVVLCGSSAARGGVVELGRRHATLTVEPGSGDPAAVDLYSMLTIAAAMLLGRMSRSLMHAAAVVAPTGEAWLLAGDARTGKSTACANLIAAGWAYQSDDQVVLAAQGRPGEVRVEGWPRDFHLDEGWGSGRPAGRRRTVDPRSLGSGRWQRSAPLAGTLLPEVRARDATSVSPARPAAALEALVRQAPWLMADPTAAPTCLDLLRSVASRPAFRLILGRDSFRDPTALLAVLGPAVDPTPPPPR